ncbi:tetratricopeptide repeat-containing sulfotransferase family protein [Blastopirellula retiformator]|uniref:Cellulose synthase subunit BcsC n=1 Tax=Blastopirellula retiformator TaxID=2527970 RepID=A0A5C5VAU5_9BACT|nr:tetratricopeptide repeat-containing sulfotransferase family protein [Blastopirellula retiformator]TWT34802.1 cellulose synthase subunit BcsC [Blastopirellula retiformator]
MNNGLQAALELHQAGDLASAERAYRQILQDVPTDANALHLLGLNLHEQGRSQEGLVLVKQAVDLKPSVGVLHNSLGVLQMALGDLQSAESSFRKAASLDSGCVEAKRNLAAISERLRPASAQQEAAAPLRTQRESTELEEKIRRYLAANPHNANAYVQLAQMLKSRGEQQPAIEMLTEAVRRFPGNRELRSLLGEALGNLGRHEEAEAVFTKLAEELPGDAMAHTNLGVSQLAQDRLPEASASLEQACRLDPQHFRAHFLSGVAKRKAGNVDQAETSLCQALKLNPDFHEARLELAFVQKSRGDYEACARLLQEILKMAPCHAPALLELATCCEMLGDVEQLVQACVNALQTDPKFAPAHLLLGMILSARLAPEVRAKLDLEEREELGEKALRHLSAAASFAPSAEAFDAWGRALIQLGRHAEALEKVQEAIRRQPDFAHAHEALGRIFLEQGAVDQACASFSRAIEIDPLRTLSQYELARSGKTQDKPQAIRQIQALLQQDPLSLQDQVFLNFALGVLFDAVQDYDSAFEHYQIANRLKNEDPRKRSREGDREGVRKSDWDRTLALKETFHSSFFGERPQLVGSESDLPIFIVGMPRSGTTLVEQILSSHPEVCGAGELMDITDLTLSMPRRLGVDVRYPQAVEKLDGVLVKEMAESYLGQLRSRSSAAKRVTDKMPTNFRHLGFVAMLFPRAHIINVRRDSRDVCISCFRQNLDWPYCDLEACARYYRQYLRLMSHWKEATPLKILDIQYEELVADPDRVSRQLVEFCGLPWDDSCLRFHASNRAVQTPSKWQVRQPVYHSSVGAWKRYQKHLGPLEEVLADRG